jgi:hypothetical protein
MKQNWLLLTALLWSQWVAGQDTLPHIPCPTLDLQTTDNSAKKRAENLLEAFEHGHFHGHFRTFFMATDNAPRLSDYHAWAAGGGLHFSTAPWYGFSFGLGGIFNFNLASSDLGAKDSLTGASNRYEIGLFDVEDPYNGDDLDRIEELWLRYQWKKSRITVGQQSLQTPFINYQDGRMRPTAEAGVWMEINELKSAKIEGGWLWKISPRSTVKWYDMDESIGLYPQGLNPDGSVSGYPDHLESKGVGLLGVTRQVGQRLKIQAWNQWVENMFNTVLLQADYQWPLKNGRSILSGLQYTHQNALAFGGNEDAAKTYFQRGEQSRVISAQLGWQQKDWQFISAYTRVTSDGRFLSPREWGREPFYTFMSRERVEGSGDSHSIVGKVRWQSLGKKWQIETAYGHFYLPDVKNTRLNKYAFPSFNQFNLDVRYAFGGVFEGLKAQFLYVWKGRIGETYGKDRLVINRVNVSHYNLVLNYTY